MLRWQCTQPPKSMQIQEKRILITGGAGLVGSHIADLLVARGAGRIVVFDNFVRGRRENLAAAMKSGRIEIVEGDIRNRELVRQTMQGVDLLFHQAAKIGRASCRERV